MIHNDFSLFLFGIRMCFLAGTIAHEAIIGGKDAKINQFPYQVSVQLPERGHICGGGIIGDLFILTAGHCVVKADGYIENRPLFILTGTNSLSKTDAPAVTAKVKKIFLPKSFSRDYIYTNGDVAVLMLNRTLGLKRHKNLKKLKLPSSKDETYIDKIAEIAGFGWNWFTKDVNGKETGGNVDSLLRFAATHVTNECHKNFFKYVFGSTACQTHLCAKVNLHAIHQSGACFVITSGDSGGPLVYDQKIVIGVLSNGPLDCLETDIGSVYTRLAHYLDFIHSAMQDKKHEDINTLELIP